MPSPNLSIAYYTPAHHAPLPPGSYRTSVVPRVIRNHPCAAKTTLPVVAQDLGRRFRVR